MDMNTTIPTTSFKKATYKHFKGKQMKINNKKFEASTF